MYEIDFGFVLFAILAQFLVPILVVAGVIGLIVRAARRGSQASFGGGWQLPMAGVDLELQRSLELLQRLIAQAQRAPQIPGGGPAGPSQALLTQWPTALANVQNQMGQLDSLHRQQHDVFVSGLLSQASSAGLDVSGWNLR